MSDRYAFVTGAAMLVRSGRLTEIDQEHLAEELDQLGRSDAHELSSRIREIMEHRLKLLLTDGLLLQQNERGWEASILRQQDEIRSLLEESPSLGRQLTAEKLSRIYRSAARVVDRGYAVTSPDRCPWTAEDLLGEA
jgi:hypothetical protein